MADITGGDDVRAEALESFALRGGFLKPYEGAEKLEAVDELLAEDLAALSS